MSKNNFSICDFRKINVSKLEYSSPKTIQGGNQSSYIYYRESHNKLTSLFIRIPKLRTSSGICRKSSHYYIDLELDLTNEHSDLFDFLIKIDKNNRLITFQNSVEWFGDQIPQDTIEDYYIPSVKLNAGGKNSTFNLRIPVKGNTLIPQIYNNNTVVDHSYVSPHDDVDCIISLAEVRYSSEKFYPIWNLIQLRINKQITHPYPIDNILIEDDDDKLQIDNKIKASERVEEIKKLEKKHKLEQERLEKERLEKERLEKERLERLEKEILEQEILEQERLEQERLEKEILEQERLEKERLEKERLEQEELEQEGLEQERLEKDKLEHERLKKEMEEKSRFERFKKNTSNKNNHSRNISNSDDILVESLLETTLSNIDTLINEKESIKDVNDNQELLNSEAIKKKQKLVKLDKERIEKEKLNKILEEEQQEKNKLKQRLELERQQKEKLMLKKQDNEGIFKEKLEREKIRKQLDEERLEKEIILQKIEEEHLETERLQKLIEEEELILEEERLEEEARLLEEEKLQELERQKEEQLRLKEEERIKNEKVKLKKLEKLRKIQQEMKELENDINIVAPPVEEMSHNKFYEVDPDVKDELGLNDFEELSFD
jgi:hypothetical protein